VQDGEPGCLKSKIIGGRRPHEHSGVLTLLTTRLSVAVHRHKSITSLTNNASLIDVPSAASDRIRVPLSLRSAVLSVEDRRHGALLEIRSKIMTG
jgi:hypothetical protein